MHVHNCPKWPYTDARVRHTGAEQWVGGMIDWHSSTDAIEAKVHVIERERGIVCIEIISSSQDHCSAVQSKLTGQS